MPYTTINSGDYITSDWANTNVRDQVVTPFASTAARTSAITVPVAGMVTTITSNAVSEGIYHYTSANTWRQPWNMPWGNVAISATPAAFTFTTTQGNSSTFTWTAVNRRNYLFSVTAELNNGTAINAVSTLFVENSAGTDLKNPLIRWTPRTASDQVSSTGQFIYTSTASGTQTWQLSAVNASASGTETITPFSVIITDIGPSGAPA